MLCARCGEEITAPVWLEGKPYGYTCARIVLPGARAPKTQWEPAGNRLISRWAHSAHGELGEIVGEIKRRRVRITVRVYEDTSGVWVTPLK